VKIEKDGKAVLETREKLRQKKHWRQHRMLLDMWLFFEDEPSMRQVYIYINTKCAHLHLFYTPASARALILTPRLLHLHLH
jgi:hypothetical protein